MKPEYSASTSRDMDSAIGPFLLDAEIPLIKVNNESVFVAIKSQFGKLHFPQHDFAILLKLPGPRSLSTNLLMQERSSQFLLLHLYC